MHNFIWGLRILSDHSRKYYSKSRNDRVVTGTTMMTPAHHALRVTIVCKSVLARATKLKGIK
jgi:hypothetical protein